MTATLTDRFSILLGLDASLYFWTYKPVPSNTYYIFYDDKPTGEVHTHLIPSLSPFTGISINIGKRFSLPIKIGYRYNFHPSQIGRQLSSPLYLNFGINYHFKSLKRQKKELKF